MDVSYGQMTAMKEISKVQRHVPSKIQVNQDHQSHGSVRHVHPSHHPIIRNVLFGNGRITRFDDNNDSSTTQKNTIERNDIKKRGLN
jgi:hypothetical protein